MYTRMDMNTEPSTQQSGFSVSRDLDIDIEYIYVDIHIPNPPIHSNLSISFPEIPM